MKLDLDELERTVCTMNPGVGPSTTIALITRIRELEAALGEALNHLTMATTIARDDGSMDRYDASEETRWIKKQQALLEKGATSP